MAAGTKVEEECVERSIAELAAVYASELVAYRKGAPFDLIGASFGSTLAHQIGLAAQRLGGNPRRLVLIEPPPPGPFPRGMRYLGQGRKVTLHDAAEACLLIRATAEAAAQRPERGADAEADQPPPTNKTTEELLAELRDLPDAALGYFITKAFPTMGRSEEEAVRTTSRTLHVVRHMQTLVFHEWMERKDPLPRFTGPDGSAAIFVVKATRRKEWLQKLFGSVSGDLLDAVEPAAAGEGGGGTDDEGGGAAAAAAGEPNAAAAAVTSALRSWNPVKRAAAAAMTAQAKAEFDEVCEVRRDRTTLLGPSALEIYVPGNHTHVSAMSMCVSYRDANFRANVERFLAPDAPTPPPLRPTGAAQCVAPLQNMAERVDAQVDVPRWLPELVFGDLDELRSAVKRPGVNMEDFV